MDLVGKLITQLITITIELPTQGNFLERKMFYISPILDQRRVQDCFREGQINVLREKKRFNLARNISFRISSVPGFT